MYLIRDQRWESRDAPWQSRSLCSGGPRGPVSPDPRHVRTTVLSLKIHIAMPSLLGRQREQEKRLGGRRMLACHSRESLQKHFSCLPKCQQVCHMPMWSVLLLTYSPSLNKPTYLTTFSLILSYRSIKSYTWCAGYIFLIDIKINMVTMIILNVYPKPQWDTTLHLSGWLLSKRQQITNVGKDVKKWTPCTLLVAT